MDIFTRNILIVTINNIFDINNDAYINDDVDINNLVIFYLSSTIKVDMIIIPPIMIIFLATFNVVDIKNDVDIACELVNDNNEVSPQGMITLIRNNKKQNTVPCLEILEKDHATNNWLCTPKVQLM